ncbi:dihydropteroate synthase [Coprobacter sp.]
MDIIRNKPVLYINLNGDLVALNPPLVMGILNVTPDSFYAGSRCRSEEAVALRAREIVEQGGTIIDIGAYSSRPQADDISQEEEIRRLSGALKIIRTMYPDVYISVDTFRADVARHCVEEFGVSMINDISGGELDNKMFDTVADLQIPYILMHMRGTPQIMQRYTDYDNIVADLLTYFSKKTDKLRLMGVNDIILDPGFGFSKTLDDNYLLMNRLSDFQTFELPLLSGISRKSMIYRFLGTSPEESLTGTTVLNTLSLLGGADILRVHDVREAVETVKIVTKTLTIG